MEETYAARFPVYAFVNQKGGCGKTTTAVHLAGALAARGERIAVAVQVAGRDVERPVCERCDHLLWPESARAVIGVPGDLVVELRGREDVDEAVPVDINGMDVNDASGGSSDDLLRPETRGLRAQEGRHC